MAKKVVSFTILTIVCFLLSIFIYSQAFGETTRIKMNAKVYKDNEYQVFFTNEGVRVFNGDMAYNTSVSASDRFQEIYFQVKGNDVDKVRIDFGTYPGIVSIKDITFERAFTKSVLSPQDIKRVFSHVGPDIERMAVEGNVLNVYSSKEDPLIFLDELNNVYSSREQIDVLKIAIVLIVSVIIASTLSKIYSYLVKRGINLEKLGFAVMVLLMISVPYIMALMGIQFGESTEQRLPAEKPKFVLNRDTLSTYIKGYEAYINDNFGLKNYFVKINNFIDVKLLNTSPTTNVTIGKQGWLYLSQEGRLNMIDMYRGITMFTPEELAKIKSNLEERRNWLKSQGIPFILLIAPNKETIYPEYLPDSIRKVQEKGRMDQLIAYLKQNSDIDIIDARETLIDHKNLGRLYYKTDSHWNEFGAFFGQQVLMNEVNKYFPSIKSKNLEDFDIQTKMRGQGGDLAGMLSLANSFNEEDIHLVPKTPRLAQNLEDYTYTLNKGVVTENSNGSLPRLLMFRDSFTVNMQPYLSEYFSTAVYQWSHSFDAKLVEQVKPDIVIHEVVERYLQELLAENPKEIKQ